MLTSNSKFVTSLDHRINSSLNATSNLESIFLFPGADGPPCRAVRSIVGLPITLTLWLMTRYGYHFTIFLLTWNTIHSVSFILGLFNLFQPGIEIGNILPNCSYYKYIFTDTVDVLSVQQWILTLLILNALTATPIDWWMIVSQTTTEWVPFFIMSIIVLIMYIYSLCKYYLDIFVHLDKI